MEIYLNFGSSVANMTYSGTKTAEEIQNFLSKTIENEGEIDWLPCDDNKPFGIMSITNDKESVVEKLIKKLIETDTEFTLDYLD